MINFLLITCYINYHFIKMMARNPRNHEGLRGGALLNYIIPRTSIKCPAIAAATAIAGLTKCVRPP